MRSKRQRGRFAGVRLNLMGFGRTPLGRHVDEPFAGTNSASTVSLVAEFKAANILSDGVEAGKPCSAKVV